MHALVIVGPALTAQQDVEALAYAMAASAPVWLTSEAGAL